jgi:FkbM family methyltransferase
LADLTPRFHISTNIEAEKILEKDYEEALLEIFLKEIRPGDIVFDIGANIGLYTLPSVLKLDGTGKVFAFEPVPLWFQRLKENIGLNKFSPHQVAPFNVGLSDKNEICEMIIRGIQGSGMGSIMPGYRDILDKKKSISIPVQMVQGYDFLRDEKIPFPNIIKIDVEGAELAVLLGLGKVLQNRECRFILCEIHPHFLTESSEQIENLLKGYGFRIQISEQRRTEYYLLARKG